jgi:hypothetical protein
MYSTLTKKNGHAHSHSKVEKAKETERRGTERHVFTATAEVVELQSGARFSTRTMDLGPGGCFVDTTVPFPVGSRLRVTLQKGISTFRTDGIVVYSQPSLGMGIAFNEQDPQQRVELDKWLADVTGDRVGSYDVAHATSHMSSDSHVNLQASSHATSHPAAHAAKGGSHHRSPEWVAMVRLVQLMIGKGILTEAEGSSVLHDPVL